MRSDVADEIEGSATVRTKLGPADLATVDALITAGIASSRADVMRWAVARIRENPAYAQLQEWVREISELSAQFWRKDRPAMPDLKALRRACVSRGSTDTLPAQAALPAGAGTGPRPGVSAALSARGPGAG